MAPESSRIATTRGTYEPEAAVLLLGQLRVGKAGAQNGQAVPQKLAGDVVHPRMEPRKQRAHFFELRVAPHRGVETLVADVVPESLKVRILGAEWAEHVEAVGELFAACDVRDREQDGVSATHGDDPGSVVAGLVAGVGGGGFHVGARLLLVVLVL